MGRRVSLPRANPAAFGTITSFYGKAKRLDDLDLPRLGALIGVGEDELHAVIEVETAGGGFDSKGRVRMLFEPHVFYRELGEQKRRQAVSAGLAYPRWGEKPYPADSYARFERAMQIDRPAAFRSASWGLGQIMGFNCKAAGYHSAEAMVAAFLDEEAKHLEAMVRFIQSEGLDDDLRRHDWSGFARGYNGAGYATHGYHTRLAAAFAKWAKIKDTPYQAAVA
ncbi:N-acetylmuramidase family protein [Falsirhodobacter sp. 20TX0035]|uniref:N-acetylmuramidase family protein n=1 Tax=Falsirhodobacter sp. 20TX0035 TaxID=3022019 RepID=UPI00232C131E|nr:N-acetylmuramidase family protein [Falsirhodobacter sp. 20TX0035]MDB6454281.1 N-acetylmuramidase family protein [Falsirhodobacter sp. 20TX0035]